MVVIIQYMIFPTEQAFLQDLYKFNGGSVFIKFYTAFTC